MLTHRPLRIFNKVDKTLYEKEISLFKKWLIKKVNISNALHDFFSTTLFPVSTLTNNVNMCSFLKAGK